MRKEDGSFYGETALCACLNKSRPGAGPKIILEDLGADLDRYMGKTEQFDDITMLALAYKENADV